MCTCPIGAAAINNNFMMLKYLMPTMKDQIDSRAIEYGPDRLNLETSLKVKEYTDYTPLMLAITSSRASYDIVRYLILNGANAFACDFHGNNVL